MAQAEGHPTWRGGEHVHYESCRCTNRGKSQSNSRRPCARGFAVTCFIMRTTYLSHETRYLHGVVCSRGMHIDSHVCGVSVFANTIMTEFAWGQIHSHGIASVKTYDHLRLLAAHGTCTATPSTTRSQYRRHRQSTSLSQREHRLPAGPGKVCVRFYLHAKMPRGPIVKVGKAS